MDTTTTSPLVVTPGQSMAAYEGQVIRRVYDLVGHDDGMAREAMLALTDAGYPLAAVAESDVQNVVALVTHAQLSGEGSLAP